MAKKATTTRAQTAGSQRKPGADLTSKQPPTSLRIFLSWSGMQAREVALALKGWLTDLLPAAEAWMSEEDLGPGVNWLSTIAVELVTTNLGIVCVTPDSLGKPWLLFEAGALSTHVNVIPYLFRLKKTDLTGPLAQFQALEATQEGTLRLASEINRLVPTARLPEARLRSVVATWWPSLEKCLKSISAGGPTPPVHRDTEEILSEVLDTSRFLARSLQAGSARGVSRYEIEAVLRSASGKPYDPIGLAILSSFLPASFSWLAQISLDLYRRLEDGSSSDPGRELRRLKYLLDICLGYQWSDPGKISALEYFSEYILFIARRYENKPPTENEGT